LGDNNVLKAILLNGQPDCVVEVWDGVWVNVMHIISHMMTSNSLCHSSLTVFAFAIDSPFL
jgi:hypothetical protein